MPRMTEAGSPSIENPTYWWYQARAQLLQTVMEEHVHAEGRLLDVGSADGPSVGWLRGRRQRVALDVDPRGLEDGDVCGSRCSDACIEAIYEHPREGRVHSCWRRTRNLVACGREKEVRLSKGD